MELSLSDRSKMEYPILLGRKFLQKKFVAGISEFHLSRKKKIIQIGRGGISQTQNSDVSDKKAVHRRNRLA